MNTAAKNSFADGVVEGLSVAKDGYAYFYLDDNCCKVELGHPQVELLDNGEFVRVYFTKQSCIDVALEKTQFFDTLIIKPMDADIMCA
jgi:hypothetical protein